MPTVDDPTPPDPARVDELRGLRKYSLLALAGRNDLFELHAEIKDVIKYYQILLQGQKNVSNDLGVGKLDTGMALGGAAVALGGIVLFVAAPPAGALLWWLGAGCTAGGAVAGGYGLLGIKDQKDTVKKWKNANENLEVIIAELTESMQALEQLFN